MSQSGPSSRLIPSASGQGGGKLMLIGFLHWEIQYRYWGHVRRCCPTIDQSGVLCTRRMQFHDANQKSQLLGATTWGQTTAGNKSVVLTATGRFIGFSTQPGP